MANADKDRIEKIVVQKTVTAEDYKKAINFNVFFRSRFMTAFYFVLPVLSVLEIIYCLLTGLGNNYATFTMLTAVAVLGFLGFVIYKANKAYKRIVHECSDIMGEKRTVIFDEENVTVESRTKGEFDVLDWDTLEKAYVLKDYFIIYFTLPKTISVPKSVLDYDEIRELNKMLQKKCAPKNYVNRAK